MALQLGCAFKGPAELLLHGINEIHGVQTGDVTFSDNAKYHKKALLSAASAVIINEDVEPENGKGVLITPFPFDAFNGLAKQLRPLTVQHAAIDSTATVGEGTVLQPGVVLGKNVSVGKDCVLHANVVVYDNCIIGDRVEIHANTVVGSDAYYFKRKEDGYHKLHSCGRVIIEDDVEIGACCTIDRGVSADTVIGRGTKFDNQVHIGHDTAVGRHVLMAAQVGVAGVVTIENGVILWGQVGVSKDLTIGENAVIYAQSGVPKSVEGGKVYFGSPIMEAKAKMKELAWLKRLPELFGK